MKNEARFQDFLAAGFITYVGETTQFPGGVDYYKDRPIPGVSWVWVHISPNGACFRRAFGGFGPLIDDWEVLWTQYIAFLLTGEFEHEHQ